MSKKIETGIKKIKLEMIDMQSEVVAMLESNETNEVRANEISRKIMNAYNLVSSISREL